MTPRYRIEGIIGEGSATAAALGEFLRDHPGPVEIIVNSPGGNAFEGAAMLAEIEAHGQVTAVVRGIAASAASLLLMGARRIEMHPAAMLMIHDPSGMTYGTAAAHRDSADTLDRIAAVYARAYAKRTGITERQIATMMAAETWLDAATAVQLGFADAVEEAVEPAVAARFDYSRFRNAPARLMQLARAEGWAAPTPAKSNMEVQMLDHETGAEAPTPEAAVARPDTIAERTRAKRITEAVAAAGLAPQMAAEMIEAGTPLPEATTAILRAWKANGDADIPMRGAPTARAAVGMSWDGGADLARKQADALAALVAPRLGIKHEPSLGREFLAEDAERTKLRMAHASARARGERTWTDAEALKTWMSGGTTTSWDYPVIARNATEVVVARALQQAPIGLRQVVHVISANDWRARQHWSLSGANKLTDIGEAGQPPHLVIDEKGEALPAPVRKAGFFRATEELLRNAGRSTDLETALARAMIEAANETLRSVIGAKIATPGNLSDNVAVFDSTRGNVATAPALPDVASLSVARVGLERQVDSQGTLRPVEPAILLVAPEQRTAAEKVVADLAAAEVDEVNPFTGRLRVVSDPALAGTGAGGHWYVLGAPETTDGLALILMDDMQTPRIEARESWTQFGMEWRIQWPMAAAWVRPSWFRTQVPQG